MRTQRDLRGFTSRQRRPVRLEGSAHDRVLPLGEPAREVLHGLRGDVRPDSAGGVDHVDAGAGLIGLDAPTAAGGPTPEGDVCPSWSQPLRRPDAPGVRQPLLEDLAAPTPTAVRRPAVVRGLLGSLLRPAAATPKTRLIRGVGLRSRLPTGSVRAPPRHAAHPGSAAPPAAR